MDIEQGLYIYILLLFLAQGQIFIPQPIFSKCKRRNELQGTAKNQKVKGFQGQGQETNQKKCATFWQKGSMYKSMRAQLVLIEVVFLILKGY